LNALALATAMVFSAPALAADQQPSRASKSGLVSGQSFDRFIVKFSRETLMRGNSATARLNVLNAAGRGLGLARVQELREIATGGHVIQTDRKLDAAEAAAYLEQLASDPSVEYAQVDKLNRLRLTPNDTNYSQQWGYHDSDAGIRANEAWDVATGAGVVVAVIDTGITSHSDLNANIVAGYDFITDTFVSRDGNGRDADPSDPGDWNNATECDQPGYDAPAANSSWHGTHVAGTVAAVTNNAKGVAGTAFNAKVMPLRVLGRCGGYDSDISDAIIWASGGTVSGVPANANPAEVINLSLGGSGPCDPTTQAAINTAVGNGTTIAIASGNDNINVSDASPANCANIISVASITSTGQRSSFSNYGSLIDIAAPGSTINSTLNTGTTSPGSETYASYNGTSMATPHVAGVVALIQSKATTPLTPAAVETLIKANYRPFPVTPTQTIGPGILDAKKAVDAVGGGGGGGGTTLTNGVAKTGLGASTGTSLNYTMVVPAGATGLKFVMAGGTGDADMYVKFGSAPTDSVYDCRPYATGNNETCNIATAQAGTYYVRLKAYNTFSGVSLTGSYTAGGGGGTPQTYTNGTDVSIPDNNTTGVYSNIAVSGRTGNGAASTPVAVNVVHPYIGDLIVDLVAPDGSVYNLHNRSGGSADNINTTINVNLSGEALNGTWRLRARDLGAADVGYINSWSITF
jgi:serine protease